MTEQQYWYDLIGEWEKSELTQYQFCEDRKLSYGDFMDWCGKYLFEQKSRRTEAESMLISGKFKEVKVVESSVDFKTQPTTKSSLSNMTITLPNSTRLTLDGELNLQELAILCQSLSGGTDAQC